jgi:VanZ family protein
MRTRPRRFSNADIVLAWVVVILWMAIIFVLSSQPGSPDAGSGRLRFGWEKLAHFVVFGVLGLLVANALTTGGLRSRRFWWTFVVCAAYAITDEVHQALIPGRTPTVMDIFIDMAGASAGYATFVVAAASRFARRAISQRHRPVKRRRRAPFSAIGLAEIRRDR